MTFVAGLSQFEIKAAQVQAINPLLIMLMIPLFTYGIYPAHQPGDPPDAAAEGGRSACS